MRSTDGTYKFINIHQRTKTCQALGVNLDAYKFINIHQRTKTRRQFLS